MVRQTLDHNSQKDVSIGRLERYVADLNKNSDSVPAIAAETGKKVAIIQFSGLWSEESMQDKTSELNDWISANNLTSSSEPRWAGYNPPWTIPFLRRNEVMIDVQQGK